MESAEVSPGRWIVWDRTGKRFEMPGSTRLEAQALLTAWQATGSPKPVSLFVYGASNAA